MIQTDKLTHIKLKTEMLKTGMKAPIWKTGALSAILDKIDDLLFRKNGGEKAIIHVLNKHQSFIIEHKSFRSVYLCTNVLSTLYTASIKTNSLKVIEKTEQLAYL